jgi:hypothetical protein
MMKAIEKHLRVVRLPELDGSQLYMTANAENCAHPDSIRLPKR